MIRLFVICILSLFLSGCNFYSKETLHYGLKRVNITAYSIFKNASFFEGKQNILYYVEPRSDNILSVQQYNTKTKEWMNYLLVELYVANNKGMHIGHIVGGSYDVSSKYKPSYSFDYFPIFIYMDKVILAATEHKNPVSSIEEILRLSSSTLRNDSSKLNITAHRLDSIDDYMNRLISNGLDKVRNKRFEASRIFSCAIIDYHLKGKPDFEGYFDKLFLRFVKYLEENEQKIRTLEIISNMEAALKKGVTKDHAVEIAERMIDASVEQDGSRVSYIRGKNKEWLRAIKSPAGFDKHCSSIKSDMLNFGLK